MASRSVCLRVSNQGMDEADGSVVQALDRHHIQRSGQTSLGRRWRSDHCAAADREKVVACLTTCVDSPAI